MKKTVLYLIKEKRYLSVAQFIAAIDEISRTQIGANRPNAFDTKEFDTEDKFRQTAHQMWYLSHIIPLAIGDYIPVDDEKWINFIRLLLIQQICTSPVVLSTTAECLSVCIVRHHEGLKQCFPNFNLTPKHHYLVHMPDQIRQFGPARNHWCMRTEGKNSFFKRKKLRNTINVPYSLAYDHQLWMCAQQTTSTGERSSNYLRHSIKAKRGVLIAIDDFERKEYLRLLVIVEAGNIFLAPEVQVQGVTYKKDNFILFKCYEAKEFVRIADIIVIEQNVYFIGFRCEIEHFNSHLNCYEVVVSDSFMGFKQADLTIPWPLLHAPKGLNRYRIVPLSLPDVEETI